MSVSIERSSCLTLALSTRSMPTVRLSQVLISAVAAAVVAVQFAHEAAALLTQVLAALERRERCGHRRR